jgi:Tol biopolymer transport system component
MPLEGVAPREILTDGDAADWDPGQRLAVVRPVGGRYRLEYPINTVLYETAGWISDPRFSPQGDRIAFVDHPSIGNNDGSVAMVDLRGSKTTLAEGWKSIKGLAWSPSGEEIWFSASASRSEVLRAVTLSGKQRVILQTAGGTRILDIARDGRVLLTRASNRSTITYRTPDGNDRRLSWFDWSTAADLSPDGRTLLFYEWGEGARGVPTVYWRKTTGGDDAIRLGEGKPLALSPDQRWVLTLKSGPPSELMLLPTGAGDSKLLPRSGIQEYYSGAWFPDGKRIMFAGERFDHVPRTFVQDVDGGEARAVSPAGVRATLISADGKSLAAYGPKDDYYRIPADGGELRRIAGALPGDELVQWNERFLYVRRTNDSALELFRVDLSSGVRKTWQTLEPPDKVGFIGFQGEPGAVRMTRDGQSYIYTSWQAQAELYIVEGLR